MAHQYRGSGLAGALALTAALVLPGCPGKRVRASFEQRHEALTTDVLPPPTEGRYQLGIAVAIDALVPLLRERIADGAAEAGLEEIELGEGGALAVRLEPSWQQLVVELRPAPRGGAGALNVLAGLPAVATIGGGPLAMSQEVRLAVRVPVALEVRVVEHSGLEIRAHVADPAGVRASVQLPGFPPGSGAAAAALVEGVIRQQLAEQPAQGGVILALEELAPLGDPLPLASADALAFPGGAPTVFVGLQTALPVQSAPTVEPAALRPGDSDWALRIDGEPLRVALARAGIEGTLRFGPVRGPDRLDVRELGLAPDGFLATLRIWRLRAPARTYDVRANGGIGLLDGAAALEIRRLELVGTGALAERRMPIVVERSLDGLPWRIDRLETEAGGVLLTGSLEAPPDDEGAGTDATSGR